MYRSFYNLTKKPFQISADPSFMWLGEKHKEALATLKYGILDNKGFLLLTGDVGTGKTTLINALIQSLGSDVLYTMVPDPGLEKLDFFNFISTAFGIKKQFSTKGQFLVYFREFLIRAHDSGKKVLLIIDESQLLTQQMLEEIRLLSNIEKSYTKLINIFFIGQNEFNDILNQIQNRAIQQRLTLNYNIDPLSEKETGQYIDHRLKVAGATATIFNPYSKKEIHKFSGGFPRRINIICDHCLLTGYVKEQKKISVQMVRECAAELKITGQEKKVRPPLVQQDHTVITNSPQRPSETYWLPHKRYYPMIAGGFFSLILLLLFLWIFLFPDHISNTIIRVKSNFSQVSSSLATDVSTQVQPEPDAQEEVLTPDPADDEKMPVFQNDEVSKMIDPTDDPNVTPDVNDLTDDPNVTPEVNVIDKGESEQIKEEAAPALPLPEKLVIKFALGNNDFSPEEVESLNSFASALMAYPEKNIKLTGYTDSKGGEAYNIKLSEFRANIVKSFLLGKGIRPDQIQVFARGSENPLESNDTDAGRSLNRRVEIEVLP